MALLITIYFNFITEQEHKKVIPMESLHRCEMYARKMKKAVNTKKWEFICVRRER